MAERRMFAKTIVLSDAFLDMPMSARCLYFTLGMLADDDGFVNSPKSIMRQCGSTEDDLKILLAKKFLLAYESGIIVIKHWRINNYLRNDRYIETKYTEEKAALVLDEKGTYHLGIPNNGIPSIGKDRIDKDSIKPPKGGAGGKDIKSVVFDYTDNAELQDALIEFIEMRKRIKKPLTERALKIVIGKLQKMGDEKEQIEIVNQSIEHSWQTVYPIKEEKPGVQSHNWDYDEIQKLAERQALL